MLCSVVYTLLGCRTVLQNLEKSKLPRIAVFQFMYWFKNCRLRRFTLKCNQNKIPSHPYPTPSKGCLLLPAFDESNPSSDPSLCLSLANHPTRDLLACPDVPPESPHPCHCKQSSLTPCWIQKIQS